MKRYFVFIFAAGCAIYGQACIINSYTRISQSSTSCLYRAKVVTVGDFGFFIGTVQSTVRSNAYFYGSSYSSTGTGIETAVAASTLDHSVPVGSSVEARGIHSASCGATILTNDWAVTECSYNPCSFP